MRLIFDRIKKEKRKTGNERISSLMENEFYNDSVDRSQIHLLEITCAYKNNYLEEVKIFVYKIHPEKILLSNLAASI